MYVLTYVPMCMYVFRSKCVLVCAPLGIQTMSPVLIHGETDISIVDLISIILILVLQHRYIENQMHQ
jgi:hypothetical protein